MVLKELHQPLELMELPIPTPTPYEILIRVHTCAVCRTDLHIVDGELPHPQLPLILGHQIVGTVVTCGQFATHFQPGQRIGVPWLGFTCQQCRYCQKDQENLCEQARFTGYQINGGFADYCVADARFCFLLPSSYTDEKAAPLLCAGLIGYRAYHFASTAKKMGIYGFGAAAHILTQVAVFQNKQVFAFTRPDDMKAQQFALNLGATWAGSSLEFPPKLLDAALIFAPIGSLIPQALQAIDKGGSIIVAGIHMSDIPSFPYALLYHEKVIRSVANLTREDGLAFLELVNYIPIHVETTVYPLEKANQALEDLRHGRFSGSAIIQLLP